jgi:hypothetical protein
MHKRIETPTRVASNQQTLALSQFKKSAANERGGAP